MKNIKRIITVLMIATLVLLAFTSCSGDGGSSNSGGFMNSDGGSGFMKSGNSGGRDCAACDGTGENCYTCTDGSCTRCGGDGTEICTSCDGSGLCWNCEGSGKSGYESGSRCTFCNGTGKCDWKSSIHGEKYLCNNGTVPCYDCVGSGACIDCGGNRTCNICEGTGKIQNVGKKTSSEPVIDRYNYDDYDDDDDFDYDYDYDDDDYERTCSYCGGKGEVDCTDSNCNGGKCSECAGDGEYISSYMGNHDHMECPYCNNGRCDTCGGDGEVDCHYC